MKILIALDDDGKIALTRAADALVTVTLGKNLLLGSIG
jgi:hypothetical protein